MRLVFERAFWIVMVFMGGVVGMVSNTVADRYLRLQPVHNDALACRGWCMFQEDAEPIVVTRSGCQCVKHDNTVIGVTWPDDDVERRAKDPEWGKPRGRPDGGYAYEKYLIDEAEMMNERCPLCDAAILDPDAGVPQ